MRDDDRRQAAFDYAERIRARLPECLMAVREEAGLSRYGLEDACGISRDRETGRRGRPVGSAKADFFESLESRVGNAVDF